MPAHIDPLELSDEDFAQLTDSQIQAMFPEEEAGEAEASSDDDDNDAGNENQDTAEDEDEDDAEEDKTDSDSDSESESEPEDDPAEEDTKDGVQASEEEEADAGKIKDEVKPKGTSEAKDNSSDIDYKAEYEALIAPFRANNKEMQIDSVEEARTLMQMGANYNKKMAAIKPSLKYIKMLENNGLLSEDKLSYLIDLTKKNPTAIQKLLKDSGVNPLEIDLEQEHGYETNTTYNVSDTEVALDGILTEIKDTDSFQQTLDIVSNKWDAQSRQILVNNPEVIKTINDHVSAGIYDQITYVIERERMLGNLAGMSDLEAYKHVGDAINEVGGFAPANQVEQSTTANTATTKTGDPNIKARKKAAGSTKTTVTKTKSIDSYDPLSMSDEEIEALGVKGLF